MTKSCRFRQPLRDRCGSLWNTPELGPRHTSGTAGVIRPSASLQETALFFFFNPHNIPKPCGQQAASPALCVLCPERESFPPAASRAPLTSANDAWGYLLRARGDAVARYLHRRNCEGILHSSVPVSLIQHYCVLGKGVGANALPSPSFDHCVILFFYTNCV